MPDQTTIHKMRKTVQKIEGQRIGEILRACHKIDEKIKLTVQRR
jgi:hypothetical protein